MICPVLDFLQIWRNRMRRTEQLQGLRLMKFEDVYGRCYRGDLSQAEASEILGMSERTFRRWRERYEAEGAEGLYDRRLGRVSGEVMSGRSERLHGQALHEKLVRADRAPVGRGVARAGHQRPRGFVLSTAPEVGHRRGGHGIRGLGETPIAVLLALRPFGPRTTGRRPRQAAVWTRTTRPRSPGLAARSS